MSLVSPTALAPSGLKVSSGALGIGGEGLRAPFSRPEKLSLANMSKSSLFDLLSAGGKRQQRVEETRNGKDSRGIALYEARPAGASSG